MKYKEECYAKSLYNALTRELTAATDAVVSVEGFGVHWNCIARQGDRLCSIACFDVQGPEYLVHFEHDAQTQAWGRTPWKKDTVSAVGSWLQGHKLQLLYDQFGFVDGHKRSLAAIETQVTEYYPELTRFATSNLRHTYCDLYELWFQAKDRSCRISYYGYNDLPDYAFHWDDCLLFQVQARQLRQLALVIKRWLCDYTMPSDLEREFTWIDTGQLAKYYEAGRGIEGEFVLSWDSVERFYREAVRASFGPMVLALIARMRKEGYDRTLRAGHSLYSLIVSRSRRHGLRADQPSIAFRFGDGNMDICADLDRETKLSFPRIEFTPQVDALLKQLEAAKID